MSVKSTLESTNTENANVSSTFLNAGETGGKKKDKNARSHRAYVLVLAMPISREAGVLSDRLREVPVHITRGYSGQMKLKLEGNSLGKDPMPIMRP